MSNENIAVFLRKKGKLFLSFFKELDNYSNTLILDIPIDKIAKKAGNGLTSERQILFLRKRIKDNFGFETLVLHRNFEFEAYENMFKAFFPDQIKWIYFSKISENFITIWVCISNEDSDVNSIKIKEKILDIMKIFKKNQKLFKIEFINGNREEPSIASILRTIKLLEPVNIDQIISYLKEKRFIIQDPLMILKKLEIARKKNLILWEQASKCYVLTHAGLSSVPYSHFRSSSDIVRLLVLSRRKW